MERTLPHNIDAEQGVLGSIMIDPDSLDAVMGILKTEDFYRDGHRLIYAAICALHARHIEADTISVGDELERQGQLEDAGGLLYISTLYQHELHAGNIEHHAQIVRRDAEYRQLIHAAGQIASLSYTRDDAAMSRAEELIYQISQHQQINQVSSIGTAVSRYMDKLRLLHDNSEPGKIIGVPTGFKTLDYIMGGLQPDDLTVLAARPSVGKTSLALSIAEQVMGNCAAETGHKVLMFSLEMGEDQLVRRLISMKANVDQSKMRNGYLSDDEWERVCDAAGSLTDGLMWIDDTAGLTLSDLRSRARRTQMQHGLDLIIVDYMQLMQATRADGKPLENRLQEVSAISRDLKKLAKDLHVPILALAQLSRAVEQRQDKIPQLSDLRESGTIETDADNVMFLHRPCEIEEDMPLGSPYPVNLIIAKHRNGALGTIPMRFEPRLTRFIEIHQEQGE